MAHTLLFWITETIKNLVGDERRSIRWEGIIMASIAFVAVVPPPSASAPAPWVYLGGGSPQITAQSGVLTIPAGSNFEIMLTLVPGGSPTDTCIFQIENPLTFQDQNGNAINPPPGWYQNQQLLGGSSVLTFRDNNANGQAGTFNIYINAVYNGVDIQSPDPTIVNVGTDGPGTMSFHFPVKASSQEQTKLTAVAA